MIERRQGHSALRWDKAAQALKTFDPNPPKGVWDRAQKRPAGSNADEWQLFLSEYLESRPATPQALTYVAVQIAEAIDAAEMGSKRVSADGEPCGECHLKPGEVCDICGKRAASLNEEAKDHPPYDNPRDPYASKDRLPPGFSGGTCSGGEGT